MDSHPETPSISRQQAVHAGSPRGQRSTLVIASLILNAACLSAQQTPPAPQTVPSTVPQAGAPPAAAQSAPASQAPSGPQPAAAANSSTYVIGAEDMLQITVWHEPNMSGSLPVRPDGMISIALVGDMQAAGKTPLQLGADITDKAKKFIQDPSVTVVVTQVNSQKIFLVGEVGKVGPIALTPGMSPLQAIATAGGPSPYANLKRIYILRGTGAKQQKIPFNYKQALKGDSSQGIELHPGDTIVVP